MSYPFYLGENLNACAAARDIAGFVNLVERNFHVIVNAPAESATVKKLRLSALVSLVVRAVYRTGASPMQLQELGIDCYKQMSRLRAGQRDEMRKLLVAFSRRALTLIPDRARRAPTLLQRFLAEINDNDGTPLAVAQVARTLNVSASHLCRAIRTATGRTPSEYIRVAKLSKARERLLHVSVTQAAADCGFGKVTTFIALFHKHYGETPGAFRKRMSSDRSQ